MKEIFNDFYKRVVGFFQTEKNEKGENTKDTATNRLKLVLLHDRTNLDTITMQKMREQLIGVISKYIEIDREALDLNLEGEGDSIALMLNIPVVKARTKEEIEEIEKAEEEAKKEEIRAAIEAEKNVEKSEEENEEDSEAENPEKSESDMDDVQEDSGEQETESISDEDAGGSDTENSDDTEVADVSESENEQGDEDKPAKRQKNKNKK